MRLTKFVAVILLASFCNCSSERTSSMKNGSTLRETAKLTIEHCSLDAGDSQIKRKQPGAEYPTRRSKKIDRKREAIVPSSCFTMGRMRKSNSYGVAVHDTPPHKVCVPAFYIDKHEVTVSDYRKCVITGKCTKPSRKPPLSEDICNYYRRSRNAHPITCVTWKQAMQYCKSRGQRLPTEAEWERSGRGTDGRIFPWGNRTPSCRDTVMSNSKGVGCGTGGTWPVGSRPNDCSSSGVCDLAGNVREFVSDWYNRDYYKTSPSRAPTGPSSGVDKVVRGGSYNDSKPSALMLTTRGTAVPSVCDHTKGFRCARDHEQPGRALAR